MSRPTYVFYDSENARVYLVGGTPEQVAEVNEACGALLGRPLDREVVVNFRQDGERAIQGRGLVGAARQAAQLLEVPLLVDGAPNG